MGATIAYVALAGIGFTGLFIAHRQLPAWATKPERPSFGKRESLGLAVAVFPVFGFVVLDLWFGRQGTSHFYWLAFLLIYHLVILALVLLWVRPSRIRQGWLDPETSRLGGIPRVRVTHSAGPEAVDDSPERGRG